MSRLPPVEKLPLAVRKNVRDDYDNKKEDLNKQLSDVLGESWTVDINPNQIYAYATEGYAKERPGSMISAYVESAISQLKVFSNKFGDEGKAELNQICSAHTLTMDFDPDKKFTYCGCEVSPEGSLRILFSERYLATNIEQTLASLDEALNAAPTSNAPMSYIARTCIRTDYEAKIGKTKSKVSKLLGKDFTLDPGFEDIYATLKSAKKSPDRWERNIGSYLLAYMESFADALESQKFGEDDMLQEALTEAVESSTVKFRLLEKSAIKDSYCETAINNGILYLQTSPDNFGVNVHQISANLMDIL